MGTLRWLRTAFLGTAGGTAVGTALLGALTAPAGVTLLGAPLVGAVAAAVPVLVAWGTGSPRPSPRLLWFTGGAGTLCVPSALGLALLGAGGAVLLVLVLLLGSLRPADRPRTSRGGALAR